MTHCIRVRTFLCTAFTILIVGTPANAQKLGWNRSIEASGSVLFGNAEERLVAGRVQLGRVDSTLEIRSDARLTYVEGADTEGNRRVTGRTSFGSLSMDYKPFTRYSPFWFGSAETSLQQRIDYRFSTGAGAKLTYYRRDDNDASVSLAALAERTRSRPSFDAAGIDTTSAVWRGRWSLRGRIRQKLNDAVRLTHTTFYQPGMTRVARFTISSTSTLAANLTSNVALTVTFHDTYDSEARARGARKNNDGQLLFGVRAGW